MRHGLSDFLYRVRKAAAAIGDAACSGRGAWVPRSDFDPFPQNAKNDCDTPRQSSRIAADELARANWSVKPSWHIHRDISTFRLDPKSPAMA